MGFDQEDPVQGGSKICGSGASLINTCIFFKIIKSRSHKSVHSKTLKCVLISQCASYT